MKTLRGKRVITVFVVFAVLCLLIYAVVTPKIPPIPYKFLSGKPCVEYGISPYLDEYAIFCWKEPYSEVAKNAMAELASLKFAGSPDPVETMFDGPGETMISILPAEKTTPPPIWDSTAPDREDPAWVTVIVIRPAPRNVFTWIHWKLRNFISLYR